MRSWFILHFTHGRL